MQIRLHYLVFTSVIIALGIFAYMISTLFDRGEIKFTDIQKYTGPIVLEQNPYTGSTAPDIRLVLYSNFTCPNCETFSNTVRSAIEGRNVVLIWKDLPNDSLNAFSTKAALAAHCAADQGRFWQYHDLLMARRGSVNDTVFLKLATQIGLNTNRFNKCYTREQLKPVIDQAVEETQQLNITTAPTLYIGDDRFATGVVDMKALQERLDILLEAYATPTP